MTDPTGILKNISTNNLHEIPHLEEFRNLVSICLNELKTLRKDLTKAYIISQNIVIKENGEYFLRLEKDVRKENKQQQDLDVAQRQEEKILQDICQLLSNPQKEKLKTDSNEHITEKISSKSIFHKISDLIYKLISIFTSKHNNISSNNVEAKVIADPIETIQLYQEELRSRSLVLQKLEGLQQAIKQYDDRITLTPKEQLQQDFKKAEEEKKNHYAAREQLKRTRSKNSDKNQVA